MKKLYPLLPVILLFFIIGCRKEDSIDTEAQKLSPSEIPSTIADAYIDLAMSISKTTAGFTPPVAARSYGYTGLTLYEACVGGMPGYQSLKGKITGFASNAYPAPQSGKYHWGVVANRAMSVFMVKQYKAASLDLLTAVVNLENQYEEIFKTNLEQEVYDRSRAYGEVIGNAVFNFAKSDGQENAHTTNFPTSYIPPAFPGAWVPTAPNQRALQPYWGDVRTFVANNTTATQPAAPLPYSTDPSSPFYLEAKEVYDVTSALTTEQETIAKFWSDDPGKTATPPGHSMSIARLVLRKENASLAMAAETYAKVGMAVHDAFVSCWKCKYVFNLLRPVTYIKAQFNPAYTTLLSTPPFPEYTSGHSVQSGAAATVLTSLFGANYTFVDSTHVLRTDINGAPRSFPSFSAAADEAAVSRLYGGIHYRRAIDLGVDQGEKIGANILGLPFKK